MEEQMSKWEERRGERVGGQKNRWMGRGWMDCKGYT